MANAPPGGAGGATSQKPYTPGGAGGPSTAGPSAAPPPQTSEPLPFYPGLESTQPIPQTSTPMQPYPGLESTQPYPQGPAPIAGENPYPPPQTSTPMQPYPQPMGPPPTPMPTGGPQNPYPQPQPQPQQPFNPMNDPGYMALMQQIARQRSMGGDPMNGLQGMYGRMENPGMTAQQMRFGMPHAVPPTAAPNGETSPAPQVSDPFPITPNTQGSGMQLPPKMAANLSRMMGAGGPPNWMMSKAPEAASDRKIAGNPNATPIGRRMGRAKGGNE